MEPITEQREVPALVVYGYLQTRTASVARHAALARALAGYCELHELVLAAIFTDDDRDGSRAPGFSGLLGAISGGVSYGLVMPTRAHLGSGRRAVERLAAITVTGRRLIVIHDAAASKAPALEQLTAWWRPLSHRTSNQHRPARSPRCLTVIPKEALWSALVTGFAGSMGGG